MVNAYSGWAVGGGAATVLRRRAAPLADRRTDDFLGFSKPHHTRINASPFIQGALDMNACRPVRNASGGGVWTPRRCSRHSPQPRQGRAASRDSELELQAAGNGLGTHQSTSLAEGTSWSGYGRAMREPSGPEWMPIRNEGSGRTAAAQASEFNP